MTSFSGAHSETSETHSDDLNAVSKSGTEGGNGKGEQKSEAKEIELYKYSKGITLTEQIILANHTTFLQIGQKGKPILKAKIDLSESQNIILKPKQEGISGIVSPILPLKFKDIKEIQHLINQAQNETIESIYQKHKSLWQRLVVTESDNEITFLAIDSVYTHFFDLFETTHYDLIYGSPGSGKNAKLVTFLLLAYRVVMAADFSGANLLDLYGSTEPGQIVIAEDEFDDIHRDPDKHKIYKIGYDFMGTAPRTLDGNTKGRILRLFNVFGPKIFAAEEPPSGKRLGGFDDRTFRFSSIKGKPKYTAKKVLKYIKEETPQSRQIAEYRDVVNEVNDLRKLTLIFRMLHHDHLIEEIGTNIDGRPLELVGPQIYLFAARELGSTYLDTPKEDRKHTLLESEILPCLSHYLKEKGELAKQSLEGVVFNAIIELFNENVVTPETTTDIYNRQQILFKVRYSDVYEMVRTLTDGTMPLNPNEKAFYTVVFGKVTHRRILDICKNKFEGEHDRVGKDRDDAFTFDKKRLDLLGKSFEVITEVKILAKEEEAEESEPKTEERVGVKDRNTSTEYESRAFSNDSSHSERGNSPYQDNSNHVNAESSVFPKNSGLQPLPPLFHAQNALKNVSEGRALTEITIQEEKQDSAPTPWQKENRGWTLEEAEAFKANQECNGIMFGKEAEG